MKFLAELAVLMLMMGLTSIRAEVVRLTWDTAHAAPVQTLAPEVQPMLPAFRMAVATLPESAIVKMALSQPAMLGLSSAHAATLAPLVARRYELISGSPEFSQVRSLLPYCYTEKQPAKGLALMHKPVRASVKSPVLVFLHGYGGSFLWYLHWLSEAFPDHIIITPAYGVSPAEVKAEYLAESIRAASAELRFDMQKPFLLGLSAGGFGASRVYARSPQAFQRLVVLAAYPPADAVRLFTKSHHVHCIAGSREFFVVDGLLRTALHRIRQNSPQSGMTLVAEGDHFFMLTHPKGTLSALKAALAAPR